MKRLAIFFVFLTVILLTLTGCGNEDGDQMIIPVAPLTDSQVSNFLFVLPVILDFSEKYQARLTPQEKESADYEEKYFRALKESAKISDSIREHHFRNTAEMMTVYLNVNSGYLLLKEKLTNQEMITALGKNLEASRTRYYDMLEMKDLTKEQVNEINDKITVLKTAEIRYGNILIMRKYVKDIDRISQSRGQ